MPTLFRRMPLAALAIGACIGPAQAQITAPSLSSSREMPAAPEPLVNGVRDLPVVHSIGVGNLEDIRVREGLEGHVLVQVTVAASGAPSEVLVIDEAPRGAGFGERARQHVLTSRFGKEEDSFLRVLTVRFPPGGLPGIAGSDRPSAESIRRQNKAKAAVVVEVRAAPDGTVEDVRVLEEAPAGKGYGDAAAKQARLTKSKSSDHGGFETRTLTLR